MIYITTIKKTAKKGWELPKPIRFKVFEVEDATILECIKHNITILLPPGVEQPAIVKAIDEELTALAKAGKFSDTFLGELKFLAQSIDQRRDSGI